MRIPTLVLAVALAAPTVAEEAPGTRLGRAGVDLVFETVGHRFTLPTPDWLTPAERLSPDLAALVEHTSYADAGQGFVEFFPLGQSIDTWSTTYAARATLLPDRSLDDYRRATMAGYRQICADDAIGFFNFGVETDSFFPALGMVCGAYRDTGRLAGQGEVMVAVFRKSAKGIAMVYQEWKGPAFDPSDLATWPVDSTTFEARAAELQAGVRFEPVVP